VRAGVTIYTMQLSALVRVALLALLCLCAQPLCAAVGSMDAFEGDVRVISTTADRAAIKGMELNEGDTIKTGANAWALLAMSDGASMTLRPQSQVRLDKYHYDPDGEPAKNSSALSLLQGAFRSVTGYIGRTNRDGYRISTPTATIGIRGTDHEPAYYAPPRPGEKLDHEPGTYDKVNEGESVIRNPKGEIPVKRGQNAFVHHDGRVAPRLLARAPAFYQRHAQFDRRAAVHRQNFHRQFEQRHQRQLEERRSRQDPRKDAQQQRHERVEHKQAERAQQQQRRNEQQQQHRTEQQQQRRDSIEKRPQDRHTAQEQKKQERSAETRKRPQEHPSLQDQKRQQERAEELRKRQQEHAQKKAPRKEHEDEKKANVRHR
jgi:hypothetical protein